ncbi:hypothetical protein [Flexivirga meconopsidis]|uniref:hypothetical protein n=1 Tax=Flexivirga meconopsidis TaxID=2977121 RepID=UPI00223EC396|nr:hypothetical protein [Flexivirga meconopsidis]
MEAALLDAIFSIRARYGGPTNGVRAVVNRWSSHRDGEMNDLAELARAKPAEVAAVVDNRTKASGRLKSEIVVDAANALVAVGPCMQMI